MNQKSDWQINNFISDNPANDVLEATLDNLSNILQSDTVVLWYHLQSSEFQLLVSTSDAFATGTHSQDSEVSKITRDAILTKPVESRIITQTSIKDGYLIHIPLSFRKKWIALIEVITPQKVSESSDAFKNALTICKQLSLYLTNPDITQELFEILLAKDAQFIEDIDGQLTIPSISLKDELQKLSLELEEERDRFDKLYQITSELALTLDMKQLLERSLRMVSKAVGADDGVIMLMDPATDNLYSRAWINPHNTIMIEDEDMRTHPIEGLAEWLIHFDESGENVVLVDDLNEMDYWDEAGRKTGLRSALAVMLENNDDPVGVIVLMSNNVGKFTENDLKLLVPVATQISASINSADLYQLIRDQAERMGKLLRKEQEEAQKNSAVVESITDGVMLANSDGTIILFNTAAELLLGITSEEALGQPVTQLGRIYGQSFKWAQIMSDWMEYEETKEQKSLIEQFEYGDKVIQAQLSPVYISDLFLGAVSIFRDITESFRLEDMMRNQLMFAERSASILEGLQDGVIYIDVSGTVGLFNSQAETLLNIRRDRVLNKNIYWLMDTYPNTIAIWAKPIAQWTDSVHMDQEVASTFEYDIDQQTLKLSMNYVYLGSEYLGSVTVIRI